MKIHRNILQKIFEAIDKVMVHGLYADKVIESYLKQHKKWGARDRRFFAENVYDVIRWYRLLAELAKSNENYKIWAALRRLNGQDLPPFDEFNGLFEHSNFAVERSHFLRAIRESIPDPLDEIGFNELGKDWDKILSSLNEPASVFLRVNTLKFSVEQVIQGLAAENVVCNTVNNLPWALKLQERKNVFSTKCFHSGGFEVQDAASQMVAPLLRVEPGMRVVDACAGAGGKTLHLANIMKNKGRIIAMDIHERRLGELKKRARRHSIDIIETRLISSSKVIKRMEQTADRVLLDVPCTGLGVLKRNPDAKWKFKVEDLGSLHQQQSEILNQYSIMTKKGGLLVYATCSILPSENEKQVVSFLKKNLNEWSLLNELKIRPDIEGYDGFYAALMQRK